MIISLIFSLVGALFGGLYSMLGLDRNVDTGIFAVFDFLADLMESGAGVVCYFVGEEWYRVFMAWLFLLIDVDFLLFCWRMVKEYLLP